MRSSLSRPLSLLSLAVLFFPATAFGQCPGGSCGVSYAPATAWYAQPGAYAQPATYYVPARNLTVGGPRPIDYPYNPNRPYYPTGVSPAYVPPPTAPASYYQAAPYYGGYSTPVYAAPFYVAPTFRPFGGFRGGSRCGPGGCR